MSLSAIRAATKFTSASQIPSAFVRKNAELHGKLVNVGIDGIISIDHTPIIKLPWHHLKKSKSLKVFFLCFSSYHMILFYL